MTLCKGVRFNENNQLGLVIGKLLNQETLICP